MDDRNAMLSDHHPAADVLCGKRNTEPFPDDFGSFQWLKGDFLRMCLLPAGHEGEHHWRIPSGWRGDDPNYEENYRIVEAARTIGHKGATAVDEYLEGTSGR